MVNADVGGVLRFAIAAVRAAVIDLPVAVGPAAAAAAQLRAAARRHAQCAGASARRKGALSARADHDAVSGIRCHLNTFLGLGVAAAARLAVAVVPVPVAAAACAASAHAEHVQLAVPLAKIGKFQRAAALELDAPVAAPVVDLLMAAAVGVGHVGVFHRQRGHPAGHFPGLVRHYAVDAVAANRRTAPADGRFRGFRPLRPVPVPLVRVFRRHARCGDFHPERGLFPLPVCHVGRVAWVQHRQFLRLSSAFQKQTFRHVTAPPLSAALNPPPVFPQSTLP